MSIVQERNILRAEIRQRKKEVLPRLREAVTRAKKKRKQRVKDCEKFCVQARRDSKKRADELKKRFSQILKRVHKKADIACKACKTAASTEGLKQVQDALEALEKETKEVKAMVSKADRMKSARGRKGGLRSAEVRAESDDEVIFNLGENQELVGLFKKIRKKIKKSPKRSRTEAFFEYVKDHPEELDEFRAKKEREYEREAIKMYQDLTEEQHTELSLEACQRELNKLRRAEELALQEVPF